MASEEPLNVQVARALWLTVYKELGGDGWAIEGDLYKEGRWREVIPIRNYLHDYEFLWRVSSLNHLRPIWYSDGRVGCGQQGKPSEEVESATWEEAVLRWLIAAKAAGLEVQL